MTLATLSLAPLHALLEAHRPNCGFQIADMPGGASTRRFFRVSWAAGGSAVAMYFPPTARAEEVGAGSDDSFACDPFLRVRALLDERGVRVPRLLSSDRQAGWLLVEDLGDQTLAAAIAEQPERTTALYQRAVQDLAEAQRKLSDLPLDCIVQQRSFETPLLEWELQHFEEYGLRARGVTLSAARAAQFAEASRSLAAEIRTLPYCAVHRDYQSRNLMVRGEELVWVDFQDALQGPRVYDLVALLNDSYQSFDADFVAARLQEYAEARGLGADGEAQIRREFFLVTIQRKLKDAGRFVYIERHKGDASFLRFYAPSLAKVRHAMGELPDSAHVQSLARLLDALEL